MTVSATNTFNLARNQIITKALRYIGIGTDTRNPTASEMSNTSETLNMMIKSWKNAGTYLWKVNEATLFLVKGQNSYKLDGSTANATDSYIETTLDGNVISGATSIVVASSNQFVVGYNIGIVQDDETILWTTITSILTNTIGLNNALTAGASNGNKVYVYQTKINKPERILGARYLNYSTNLNPCTLLARDTYYNLPNKNNQGQITQVYYEPRLTYGNLYVYNAPDNIDGVLKFTYEVQFFDFATAIDSPDFPNEWLLTISLNLAYWISLEYRISPELRDSLRYDAEKTLEEAQGYDRENTAIFLAPATSTYIGQFN